MNPPQVYMCSPSRTLLPPPSSLPTPSLWVVPVHQPQASSIVHRTWTGNSFHNMIFYMFQCHSPKSSHPLPLSQSPLWFFQSVSVLVAQLCPTLFNPMDHSPPGSSANEILQVRILEWVAIPFSRVSSRPMDQTWVSCIAGRLLTSEPPIYLR